MNPKIVPGMLVLSRDRRSLGTVEKVSESDFTLVDKESRADARVSYALVDSVDEEVHLHLGPCGLG